MQVNGQGIDYAANEWLPEHMRDGMKVYIERGIQPGVFMTAVLENNLFRAAGYADDINRHALFDICRWLRNCAPSGCFGSPERVRAWIESRQSEAGLTRV